MLAETGGLGGGFGQCGVRAAAETGRSITEGGGAGRGVNGTAIRGDGGGRKPRIVGASA
jgi:hypothetical protein